MKAGTDGRRRAFIAILVAVTGTAVAAPAAGARVRSPLVAHALLYKDDFIGQGMVTVIFKTRRRLPTKATDGARNVSLPISIGTERPSTTWEISGARHCYAARLFVKETIRGSYRVRLGHGAHLFGRTLHTRPLRYAYPRGRVFGCVGPNDAVFPQTTETILEPWFKPSVMFFQADGGPDYTHLRWSGWGSARATAEGIIDCTSGASCSSHPFKRPVTVTVSGLHKDRHFGTYVYTHFAHR